MTTLISAIVADGSPTQLTMTYDTALDAGSVPATSCFIVIGDGVSKTCTNVNVTGSTVVLTFNISFFFEETIILFYFTPTINPIRASGGGAIASSSSGTITNNIASSGVLRFVDPVTGNDANNGQTEGTCWKTVPGTRNVGDTNWVSTTYAGSAAAFAAGTRIVIKAGSTFSSATGARVLINSTWYSNGTAKNPTTIKVSDTWGTGNVTYDATGVTQPGSGNGFGLVSITQRNNIHFRGANATARITIRDSNASGLLMYGSGGTHAQGLICAWIECTANSVVGCNVAFTDNSLARNCEFHTNGSALGTGMWLGFAADQTNINMEVRDTTAHHNAPNWAGDFEGLSHGFQFTGQDGLIFRRCGAWNNGRDGFDGGSATNGANGIDNVAYFVDSYAHDNGEENFAINGGTLANGPVLCITYHINTRVWGSGDRRTVYEGGKTEWYNCTINGAGGINQSTWTISGYETSSTKTRNCYLGRCGSQITSYTGQGGTPEFTMDSNNNIYVATTALTDDDFLANDGSTARNYNNWAHFGASDVKTTTQQSFIDSANGDFNLPNDTGICCNAGVALSTYPAHIQPFALRDGSSTSTTLGRLRDPSTPDIGAMEFGEFEPPEPPPPTAITYLPVYAEF